MEWRKTTKSIDDKSDYHYPDMQIVADKYVKKMADSGKRYGRERGSRIVPGFWELCFKPCRISGPHQPKKPKGLSRPQGPQDPRTPWNQCNP